MSINYFNLFYKISAKHLVEVPYLKRLTVNVKIKGKSIVYLARFIRKVFFSNVNIILHSKAKRKLGQHKAMFLESNFKVISLGVCFFMYTLYNTNNIIYFIIKNNTNSILFREISPFFVKQYYFNIKDLDWNYNLRLIFEIFPKFTLLKSMFSLFKIFNFKEL